MSSKEEVIIQLHETKAGYWRRMATSYALLSAFIGLGIVMNSDAMQWVGAVVGMLTMIGTSIMLAKSSNKTPQEAADFLAKNYGVVASPEARR